MYRLFHGCQASVNVKHMTSFPRSLLSATMKPPMPLSSLDNSRLKHLLHLRKSRQRRESGQFVIEGLRELSRAALAGLTIHEIYLCPQIAKVDFPSLLSVLPPVSDRCLPFLITPPILAKIAYCENPEGILALVDQPQWSLNAVADRISASTQPPLLLVAAGTNKPGNLGAMTRSAAAAGALAVLAADAEVDPFNPNAIRASTGAVFSLPVVCDSSPSILNFLQMHNFRLITASPDASANYTDADLTGPLAIVIGAEDTGLPRDWATVGSAVRIDMSPTAVDSLNASTAAAVLLFEARRQRQLRKP
jgi:RNA methyltransferase, TrmH family